MKKAIGSQKFSEVKTFLEKRNLDCILLFNYGKFLDPNITYFTNLEEIEGMGRSLFVLSRKTRVLFLGEDVYENLKKEIDCEKVIPLEKLSLKEICRKYLKKFKRIGINKSKLPLILFERLRKNLKAKFFDVSDFLLNLRAIKTKEEIEIFKRASKVTNKGIRIIEESIKEIKEEKISEADLELRLEEEIKRSKCDVSFKILVASGKRSKYIHPYPNASFQKMKKFGYVDFGVKFKGYHTDVTIPFILKELNQKEKRIVDLLLDAYELALDSIKIGMKDWKLFEIVNEFIKSKGFELKHGLGHGLGLEIHELPAIVPKEKESKITGLNFENGMVFTIEPGIYLRNFGLRIEDDFYFWKNKLKILTQSHLIEDLKRK